MVSKTTTRKYPVVLNPGQGRDGGERERPLYSFLAPRGARLGALGIPDFVGDEVADTFNAISLEAQRTGIDKVGMKDAVASFYFRADGINRVPCIIADCKGIAGVG